ncbi:MAG: hypothetical protein COA88_14580 [Kordia sp.]|nr:MAG: hypothetical protein COA88_14580 [Kordia sp.]
MTHLEIMKKIMKTQKLSKSETARRMGVSRTQIYAYLDEDSGVEPRYGAIESLVEQSGFELRILLTC